MLRRAFFLLMFGSVVLGLGVSSAQDAKKAPPAELKGLIAEAIKLLTEKEYEKLLERVIEPDAKAKLKEDKERWARIVKDFGESKAATMLKVLKSVGDTQPTMNEAGTEAVYAVDKSFNAPGNEIAFTKIKDLWYIRN